MSAAKVYRVIDSLMAVEIETTSRGEASGVVAKIPPGSTVRMHGTAHVTGMVDVEWHGRLYALFHEDLRARAEITEGVDPDEKQSA